MTKPSPISPTAQTVLAAAAETSDYIVSLPDHLPAAARRAVGQSMLKAGLVEEVPAMADQSVWRTTSSGEGHVLRATKAGLMAVNAPHHERARNVASSSPEQPTGFNSLSDNAVATSLPTGARVRLRQRLCDAAEAVLAAWDDTAAGHPKLPAALDTLRSALTPVRRAREGSRVPRTGTKQEAVLMLLRRREGATVAQVAEVTGWAIHTVRGFFAGLKKRGIAVTVLERVRQVGPGKAGAKGSYTVYHVPGAN